MAETSNVIPGQDFPAPLERYDRENEAQFRRALERTFVEVTAYNERLNVDPLSLPNLARIGASTHKSIQDAHDLFSSTGQVSGGALSEGSACGHGTVDVAAGTGVIRATDDATAELKFFDWAAETALALNVGVYTRVAQANFNVNVATELKNYFADSGFGTFNLGSGAGAGQKPWAAPLRIYDSSDSFNWGVDYTAPNTILQTSNDPLNDPIITPFSLFEKSSEGPTGFPEYGWLGITNSPNEDGTHELKSTDSLTATVDGTIVTTTSPLPHDIGTFASAGRAQNQIVVGGPEVNVGSLDIANDRLKIWARAERASAFTSFQVGIVVRTNHTAANDTGVDSIRLYLKDNGTSNVDVVVQKRVGDAAQFTEVVGTVALGIMSGGVTQELKFGGILCGSTLTVFTGEAETVLGTVDLTQGTDPSVFNDSSHQKAGVIIWNFNLNAIDNLTVEVQQDSVASYVGIEYNSGSPRVVVKSTNTWDFNTEFPLGVATRELDKVHFQLAPQTGSDAAQKAIRRASEVAPFARDEETGGLLLGEGGTRYVTLSAGALWHRMSRFAISAFDSDPAGAADSFDTWQHESGVLLKTAAVTQWPNTQYDNGTDLTTMTASFYANLWFYLSPDSDVTMVYGTAEYVNSASAEAERPPTLLPTILSSHSTLVGRIIFQKSASSALIVDTVFGIVFPLSQADDHGTLAGLADDDHVQYLLVNGTRAMTGNLDLGGSNIFNGAWAGTTISSVTEGAVTAHEAALAIVASQVTPGVCCHKEYHRTSVPG